MTEPTSDYEAPSAYGKLVIYVYEIRENPLGGLGPERVKYVAFTPGHDMQAVGGTSKVACDHLLRDLIGLGLQPKKQGYEMVKTTLKEYEKIWLSANPLAAKKMQISRKKR